MWYTSNHDSLEHEVTPQVYSVIYHPPTKGYSNGFWIVTLNQDEHDKIVDQLLCSPYTTSLADILGKMERRELNTPLESDSMSVVLIKGKWIDNPLNVFGQHHKI